MSSQTSGPLTRGAGVRGDPACANHRRSRRASDKRAAGQFATRHRSSHRILWSSHPVAASGRTPRGREGRRGSPASPASRSDCSPHRRAIPRACRPPLRRRRNRATGAGIPASRRCRGRARAGLWSLSRWRCALSACSISSVNLTYFERLESRTGLRSYMPLPSTAPLRMSAGSPPSPVVRHHAAAEMRARRMRRTDRDVGIAAERLSVAIDKPTARRTCSTIGIRLPPASSTLMKSSTTKCAPALTNGSARNE